MGQALQRGLIDEIGARVVLCLTADDPLPPETGLADEQRASLRDPRALALRHSGVALWEAFPERDLMPANPRRSPDGWVLDIVDHSSGRHLGVLKLDHGFSVVETPSLNEPHRA